MGGCEGVCVEWVGVRECIEGMGVMEVGVRECA